MLVLHVDVDAANGLDKKRARESDVAYGSIEHDSTINEYMLFHVLIYA